MSSNSSSPQGETVKNFNKAVLLKKPISTKNLLLNFFRLTFVLLLVLFLLFLLYIKVYNERVPIYISKQAEKEIGIKMGYQDFEFDPFINFPKFTYKINCIYIDGSQSLPFGKNLLEIESLSFSLTPRQLFADEKNIENIHINDAQLFIYVDEEGNKNLKIFRELSKLAAAKNDKNSGMNGFKLSTFNITDLNFEFKDDQLDKRYAIHFHTASLKPEKKAGKQYFDFSSTGRFDGLTFKVEDGPFVKDKLANLDLKLFFTNDEIRLEDSQLVFGEDKLSLNAIIKHREKPHIDLNIVSQGIYLSNARRLLSTKLQENLGDFEVDQLIPVEVNIKGPLKPHHPPEIKIDFSTANANIKIKDQRLDETTFQASFQNNCHTIKGKKILPQHACLTIHDIDCVSQSGQHIEAKAVLTDLQHFNSIQCQGSMDTDLQDLQTYLPADLDLKLIGGRADLAFSFEGNPQELYENGNLENLNFETSFQDLVLDFYGEPFKVKKGTMGFEKDRNIFKGVVLAYRENTFHIDGYLDDLLPHLNTKKRMRADLRIHMDDLNLDRLINNNVNVNVNKNVSEETFSEFIKTQIDQLNETMDLKLDFDAQRISFDNRILNNTSFKFNNQDGNILINELDSSMDGETKIKAELSLLKKNNYSLNSGIKLETTVRQIEKYLSLEEVDVLGGDLLIEGNFNTDLSRLDDLKTEAMDLSRFFKGQIELKNTALHFAKTTNKLDGLNAQIKLDANNICIEGLQASLDEIPIQLNGEILNSEAFWKDNDKRSELDLHLKIPKISNAPEKTDNTFKLRKFLKNIDEHWQKAKGK